MEKVLVPGSSGQAGQAIVERLEGYYEVIGLDRKPGPKTNQIGNLRDWRWIRQVTQGFN